MNRMTWMLSRKILFGCIVTLLSLATNAKDLALYLDYKAICQGGDCSMFVGALNNYYASPLLDEQADALSRLKADYSKLNGWDIQSLSSIYYREKCGPANVVVGALSYKPYPQKWWQQIDFVHSCQSYRPDGKAPPSTSTVKNSAQIYGYCESDSYAYKDYNTGECGRSPNECLKYPDNKNSTCGKTIADLASIAKLSNDPTRIFHQTQTCIAKKSCDMRCRMENCAWMEKVIPDFVNPYIQKLGQWQEIESSCRQLAAQYADSQLGQYLADGECARKMVNYHINVDLLQALKTTGCGSDADWQAVANIISSCAEATSIEQAPGWAQLPAKLVAEYSVIYFRNKTRSSCMQQRQAAGINTEINQNLKGKTCGTP